MISGKPPSDDVFQNNTCETSFFFPVPEQLKNTEKLNKPGNSIFD
jgi:hypothetical protein